MTVLAFSTVNTESVPLGGDVNNDVSLAERERVRKKSSIQV